MQVICTEVEQYYICYRAPGQHGTSSPEQGRPVFDLPITKE